MPFDLAGVRIKTDRTVGVQIIAGAILAVPIRSWIADTPNDRVAGRIIGAGHPGRSAAGRRGIVAILPCLDAWLALGRDRVGTPGFLLRLEIGRGDPAANAVFGAG